VPTFDAFLARVHPDDRPAVERAVRMTIADGADYDLEFRLVRPDGAVRTIHARAEVSKAADRPLRLVGIVLDITERKALEAQLAHQATHDPLTGLPNRALFHDRLDHALGRARREWQACAVLFLDLDRFKTVNDSLGHAAGDRLLIAVATRLQGCLRDGDTVARLGGDEFAILMEGVADPVEPLRVAERILATLQEPLPLDGRELVATASVGIALSTDSEDTPADLLRFADVALYRAKEAGRACYAIFYPGMNADALERLELEHDLRGAVSQGACAEFRLLYQPLVDLATGRVAGVEALVRWQHPARGLVSPGDFIPLAEETGLIVPLGRWVLGEACRQLRAWQLAYPDQPAPTLAVNLSARQFRHPDLVSDIVSTLAATDLAPCHLQLEVTETVAMERAEETVATLAALKALGLSLAIDDFGTGYSSLSYLQRLPVDVLKIDRSFFRADERNRAIVQAVAALAHGLGLDVTAEGLETAEQVAWARAAGGDRGQGYYFAHPLRTEELDALWAADLTFALPGGGQAPVPRAPAPMRQRNLALSSHAPDQE
jgi:diguanylate cyclase (GGDEF)-like protein